MSDRDANLDALKLNGSKLSADVRNAITGSANITRTIDGSPVLTFSLELSKDRSLFKAIEAAGRFTTNFNGLDFEVASLSKSKNTLKVTMEDLAVAELRRHSDPYSVAANTMTRVQFVRQLLQLETPWITLNVDPAVTESVATAQLARGSVQSTSSDQADQNYFSSSTTTASTNPRAGYGTNTILTPAQIAGAAKAAGFSGNNLVIAIAVSLAESGGNPNAQGHNTNGTTDYGLWQINSIHSDILALGPWSDPYSNAKMAYAISGKGTNWKPWSTYNSGAYKKYLSQAQTASGNPSGDFSTASASASAASTSKEDSWSCFTRIFHEVNWRLYADKGQLYAGPDWAFINKNPIVTLREFQGGVNFIDYDYDTGKPAATVTIDARVNSWVCQPGSVIEVPDMGLPITKWICSSIQRDLFSLKTTIMGTSPQPELPEPASQTGTGGDSSVEAGNSSPGFNASGGASNGQYIWPTASHNIVSPFGQLRPGHIHQGIDIGVPLGTSVVASRAGVVLQANNSDPGGYGNAVYINHDNGNQTRYAHLSSFTCRAGQSVKQGQEIGKSGGQPGTPGAGDATGPHLHFEIRQGDQAVNPIPLLSNAPIASVNDSVATPSPGAPIVGANSKLVTQTSSNRTPTVW